MTIIILAALAKNNVIGNDGKIPWFSDDEIRKPDMKRFRELTIGHSVIMGRKTLDSIGAPLRDRSNIVLTRKAGFYHEGTYSANSLADAVKKAQILSTNPDIYIIGGAEVFREALPMANRLELTELNESHFGNALFPEYKHTGEWKEKRREPFEKFSFVSYERIN